MHRATVDCWEVTLGSREAAERDGFRLGPGRRAIGVEPAGARIDPPARDAVLWARRTSLEDGRHWLEGERAPAAPWASRAQLTRAPGGYVYADPDVGDVWFATRHPQPDPLGQDHGPFPSPRCARLWLLGGGRGPGSGPVDADVSATDQDLADGWFRERAREAAVRAPMPSELLDEAHDTPDGWDALRRAWPEVAALPLEGTVVRQVSGRIQLLEELETTDPDAALDESAAVLATLTSLLQERVARDGEGETAAARDAGSRLANWALRAAGPVRRAWSGPPRRGSWFQLEERHIALQVGRITAVFGTAIAALIASSQDLMDGGREVALLSAGAMAAHLALLRLPLRRATLLRAAVDASLVVDAVWVTLVAAVSGGSESPLIGLFVLTALGATLVYSPRTGVKAAILASLAVLLLEWRGGSAWTDSSAAQLAALWLLVAIGAAGAEIGQRELRRRADRLGVLQGAGSELLGISDPAALEAVATGAAERLLPGWRASLRRGSAPDRTRIGRAGDDAIIVVPVTDGATVIGAFECRRPRRPGAQRDFVRGRDLDGLQALATALGTALGRAEVMKTLTTASTTDPLTGLANRRSFDAECARALAGLRRHGRPVSLCLLDVDHFKRFNDTHGHVEGDRALVQVGRLLGAQVRGSDVAARYGGEEFALLLPDAESEAAAHVAERVRDAVALISGLASKITVSIGVVTAMEGCLPEQLVEAADHALYAAKADGRNRVRTARFPFAED